MWIGSAQSEEDFWIQKNKFHGMVSWIVDGDDGEDGGTLVGTKVVGTKQISSFLKLLVGWFGFVSDDGDGWGWMGIQNGSWLIAIFLFYELQLFHHKKASGDQIFAGKKYNNMLGWNSTMCWMGYILWASEMLSL